MPSLYVDCSEQRDVNVAKFSNSEQLNTFFYVWYDLASDAYCSGSFSGCKWQ